MFAPLTRLLTALSGLAAAVEDMSGTVREMNAGLRGRLQLEQPDQQPAIDHEQPEGNGSSGRRRKQQPA
jgi:hypothetical protein